MPRKKTEEDEAPPEETPNPEETPKDKAEEPEETPEPEEKPPAPAKPAAKASGPDPDLFASIGRGIAAGLKELGAGSGPEKSEGKTKEKTDDGHTGDEKPSRKPHWFFGD